MFADQPVQTAAAVGRMPGLIGKLGLAAVHGDVAHGFGRVVEGTVHAFECFAVFGFERVFHDLEGAPPAFVVNQASG